MNAYNETETDSQIQKMNSGYQWGEEGEEGHGNWD